MNRKTRPTQDELKAIHLKFLLDFYGQSEMSNSQNNGDLTRPFAKSTTMGNGDCAVTSLCDDSEACTLTHTIENDCGNTIFEETTTWYKYND